MHMWQRSSLRVKLSIVHDVLLTQLTFSFSFSLSFVLKIKMHDMTDVSVLQEVSHANLASLRQLQLQHYCSWPGIPATGNKDSLIAWIESLLTSSSSFAFATVSLTSATTTTTATPAPLPASLGNISPPANPLPINPTINPACLQMLAAQVAHAAVQQAIALVPALPWSHPTITSATPTTISTVPATILLVASTVCVPGLATSPSHHTTCSIYSVCPRPRNKYPGGSVAPTAVCYWTTPACSIGQHYRIQLARRVAKYVVPKYHTKNTLPPIYWFIYHLTG